jgi:hypothetical protein
MNDLGTNIYTNCWGYAVHVAILRDVNSSRVSVDFYTISPAGTMSDLVTLAKKDLITKKNSCDFLFDMDGEFTREDIETVRYKTMSLIASCKDTEKITVQSRATLIELHHSLSEYIRKEAEELDDNPMADVFIKDSFGYFVTSKLDEFLKIEKSLGYKRVEILKRLKIMGVLQNDANRPYDMLISVHGKKRRVYKIALCDIPTDEPEWEEII